MDAQPVAVGEPVVAAAFVGEGLEPERRVVAQRGRQVPDREDRAELPELPRPSGGAGYAGTGGCRLRLDVGQGHQPGAHRLHLLGRHPGRELAVDRLGAAPDGSHHLMPALGQLEGDASAVGWVRAAVHVAPVHQDVDRLAHGLLAHAEAGGQIVAGLAGLVQAEQYEGAVSGQVLGTDRPEVGPDGAGVGPAGGAHEGRGGEVRSIQGHAATIKVRN